MEKLSFVVQGPVVNNPNSEPGVNTTAEVLNSIRRFYPDAEIVLSTWKGTDTSGLDFDRLVLNDDPGAIIVSKTEVPFNINRLIVSSINGLKKASHDLVVKTRTDIAFTNDNVRNMLHHITPTNSRYSIFSHYILTTNYYVRNPFRLHFLFHSSDILLVGKRSDLILFFDAPIVHRENVVIDDRRVKFVAEQYLTLNSIEKAKKEKYDPDELNSTNFKYFLRSEKYLFNSFNFVSIDDLGVVFPKKLLHAYRPDGNYSIMEVDILSDRYRKSSNKLDIYSYLRALKYIYIRTKEYARFKLLAN